MTRLLILTATTAFLLALWLALLVGYWVFYPYKIAEIKTPIHVLTPIVGQGGTLKYEVDVCKYLPIPAYTTRQMIGTSVIFFPELLTNLPVGCSIAQRSQLLPSEVPTGKYKLRLTNTYEVNPLRTITIAWETEEFEVK